ERAFLKTENVQQRRADFLNDRFPLIIRRQLHVGAQDENKQLAEVDLHRQIRVAELAECDEQVPVKIGGLVDRNIVRARDRDVNKLALRVAQLPRSGLANSRKRS